MVSTPTPPSLAIAEPRSLGSSMLVRPFSRIELEPPPSQTTSGLFPAIDEEPMAPERGGPGLRRAVLLTVVVGAVSLLAYASWQRASRDRAPGPGVTRTR